MNPQSRTFETKGVITKIKYPFSFFKKKNPVVSLRLYSGVVMKFETTRDKIQNLPPTIGVGMYTEVEYTSNSKNDGYEIVNFF